MKYFLILVLLLLTSCISKTEPPSAGETASGNFVDSYVDTLETSVSDARDVVNTISQEQEELRERLEGVE